VYVTVKGTVVFIEEKHVQGERGRPDQQYRLVTLLGGRPDGKPELDVIKVLSGIKIEKGQKMELAVDVTAYMRRDREGRPMAADLSAKVSE